MGGGWIAALTCERFPADALSRLVAVSRPAVIATCGESRRACGPNESDRGSNLPSTYRTLGAHEGMYAASQSHLLCSSSTLSYVDDMAIRPNSDHYRVALLSSALVCRRRKVQLTSVPFAGQKGIVLDHRLLKHGHVTLTSFDRRGNLASFCAAALP